MTAKEHWAVKATRIAATALYIVALLMGIGILILVSFIDALNPHVDGLTALYMMTGLSNHKLVWVVSLFPAGALAVTDMVFRYQGRYAKD